MIESRRRAYLEVMGYDIWSARLPGPDSNRLLIQPGEGDTLLVSNLPDVKVSRFAGDVARALGEQIVWAWPDPEGNSENPTIEEAVGHYLFTRVVVFGAGLVEQLFKGDIPMVIGSARILVTGGMDDLAASGSSKLLFWNQITGKTHN